MFSVRNLSILRSVCRSNRTVGCERPARPTTYLLCTSLSRIQWFIHLEIKRDTRHRNNFLLGDPPPPTRTPGRCLCAATLLHPNRWMLTLCWRFWNDFLRTITSNYVGLVRRPDIDRFWALRPVNPVAMWPSQTINYFIESWEI